MKTSEDDQEEIDETLKRMSLMVRFNHRGSLTSLSAEQLRGGSRRNSSSSELTRSLLKSAHETSNFKAAQATTGAARTVQPMVKASKVTGDLNTPQQIRKSVVNKNLSAQPFPINEEFRTRSGSILEEDESQTEESSSGTKKKSKSESEVTS